MIEKSWHCRDLEPVETLKKSLNGQLLALGTGIGPEPVILTVKSC